ncbi:MAG TPA: hypothetical protein VF498_01975, partial [Anaerolineales bacterium]
TSISAAGRLHFAWRAATRSTSSVASASGTATSNGGSRTFDREFKPDYSQVIRDLRRIAVLAGSFFVILIALSFILPLFLK